MKTQKLTQKLAAEVKRYGSQTMAAEALRTHGATNLALAAKIERLEDEAERLRLRVANDAIRMAELEKR